MRTVVRWNPVRNVVNMQRTIDRLFDEYSGGHAGEYRKEATEWKLPIDLVETEAGYELQASLPGVNSDDIDITLNEKVLVIRAEVKKEEQREEDSWHIRERRWGSFSRSVRLPKEVDIQRIEANFENGVLLLSLPQSEETKPKRIAVKVRSGSQLKESE